MEHHVKNREKLTLHPEFFQPGRVQGRRKTCSPNLALTSFFQDPAYARLWTGNIARNLLDHIYQQELDKVQRAVLLAFSVYREPVPIDTAQFILDARAEGEGFEVHMHAALDALLTQHLLQASGEAHFQLHTIVGNYAQGHFVDNNEQANRQAVQAAHARAAHYYLHLAATTCLPREKRRHINDIDPLIEAVWHYCQAALGQKEQEQQYYKLALSINREIGDRRGEGRTLNNLGAVYAALKQRERALECFAEALNINRETRDREGEGKTFRNIGILFLAERRYDVAAAALLLAQGILNALQSPSRYGTQEEIDALSKEIGAERFTALLARVEPQAPHIVKEALA